MCSTLGASLVTRLASTPTFPRSGGLKARKKFSFIDSDIFLNFFAGPLKWKRKIEIQSFVHFLFLLYLLKQISPVIIYTHHTASDKMKLQNGALLLYTW